MSHMGLRIALETPLPGFGNEFCDILKLFFAVDHFEVNQPEGTGETLQHDFAEVNGEWICQFTFRQQTACRRAQIPLDTQEQHRPIVWKRLQKRLCKLTLYDLLRRLTGHQPPWGSLTGIRPTRLVYENLAQGMSLKSSTAQLTQEFDVTPEKAELLRRIVAVQQGLLSSAHKEVDVYVSIPFCRTRCAYCSFPGEALGKAGETDAYLTALYEEMEMTAQMMDRAGLQLRALYIGGGTPTVLSEQDFHALLWKVRQTFQNPLEFTVEAGRPDTITTYKLQDMLDCKVGRISINPQTMNDVTLRRIGRGHTAQQTREAFALARNMGFQNINMDVIAGLPGEDEQDFGHTMDEISQMEPDSLTIHTLAVKRSSRLNLEGAALPDGKTAARMIALGEKTAYQLGMVPYYLYRQKYMAGQQQNVGYALPGSVCLYNVDIMEENTSILALGAGAISKRVFPDKELRIERAPNVSNVAVYVSRVQEMIARKMSLFT